jgi:hypothetical protein
MSIGWLERNKQSLRLEAKREKRLTTKLQKAGAITLMGDVQRQPSWNKRFGLAARLRVIQDREPSRG